MTRISHQRIGAALAVGRATIMTTADVIPPS